MSDMIQCNGNTNDLAAYFLAGRVVPKKCSRPAVWEVSVNPPTPGNDGKVRLCELCNGFDFQGFPRTKIPHEQSTEAEDRDWEMCDRADKARKEKP